MTWSGRQGSTWAWRTMRQLILKRDDWTCTRTTCGERCTNHATEVDHIVPVYQGGTDTPNNLASVCSEHHQEKTKRESATARWRYKTARPQEQHPGLNRNVT